jgi:glucose/arabinose dehydrogenase
MAALVAGWAAGTTMRPSLFLLLVTSLLIVAGCSPDPDDAGPSSGATEAAEQTEAADPGDGGADAEDPGEARTQEPTGQPTAPPHDDPTEGTPTAGGPVEVAVSDVATGLAAPWAIAITDEERVFITERDTGRVLELGDDGSTAEVRRFDVDNAGEGGLLGLVDAPDGGDLYAYLTGAQDNRVVRFDPDGDAEPDVVLDGIPKANVHNGGRIAFGPDGLLYIGTGDATRSSLAQDEGSLAGKILRVTPDGDVPDDNPIAGSPVWSLGHRNVQGLDWSADGTLYASEFGPDVDDEINPIEPGANYGWPEVTGEAGDDRFVDPIFVRQPAEASWSGLLFVSGGAIPQWAGSLLAPSLRGNRLWRIELDGDGAVAGTEELLVGEHGRLRQAVLAPDGAVWVLTNNADGRGRPAPDDDRILRLGPAE